MCEVYMSRAIESSKLVQGIGTKGTLYPTWNGKINLKEYDIWVNMLRRCTEKLWTKRPTYIGTTCSENFKSYSFFYEWCQTQFGFGNIDEKGKSWQLDKDILFKGNKVYSEDTCVFVPHKINTLITKSDCTRGSYPVGVSLDKNNRKFAAYCNDGVSQQMIGRFATEIEAFEAYKTFKEAYIKQVAEQYKSQIDPRAYKALLEYEVNIED